MARRAVTEWIDRGREAYASGAWEVAHESLTRADGAGPLDVGDLELLATSAYMLGDEEECVACLERAYHAHLAEGEALRAARCGFWMGIILILTGEMGRATGWVGRAQRLVESQDRDCVEAGYRRLVAVFEREAAGDREGAIAAAAEAAATGRRFADADLFALASQDQGILLVKEGKVAQGLALMDEAMLAVTTGELSPMVNGFVYCGVIMGCQAAYEPRRAKEWTAALTRWCERQPEMVNFTGTCLVHRAEIMQLHGAWPQALDEARRAGERGARAENGPVAAQALYRQGEVLRLQGEFAAAEEAYRGARHAGFEPQPGLALLRLAQGNRDAAAGAIRRLMSETPEPSKRAGLLPAYVEIALAAGDAQEARGGCAELEEIARRWEGPMVEAMAAHARGAVDLAEGDAESALVALRRAERAWRELEAPYEAARASVLVGLACRALGDDDSAALELDAARGALERLGATPDVAAVDRLAASDGSSERHGLTAREVEVLRLVASGMTNREIASALTISEHTVARHVQNILAKLRVSSRTAASAFAFAHDLV